MALAFISGVDESIIIEKKWNEFGQDYAERIQHAVEVLQRSKIYIECIPDFSVQDIENCIKRHLTNPQKQVEYVFFDYIFTSPKMLREMRYELGGGQMREDQVLNWFSTKLKEICVKYSVFIMTSTQLNKDWKQSPVPDQNLLRGAKSIADKCDWGSILLDVTEEDKEAWTELNNVVAIHNPVSFNPVSVSSLKEKRVIAVGRYAYQKGFDLLLRAWKKVEMQCPDWELSVYGDGDRSQYEQLAEELGIDATRCHLNPPTNQIQKEYIGSSVFAVSSRFEGLSMALLEAAACGLPIVSFACPCGPRDLISDGEDGLLVEKENVDALADSLTKVMRSPEIRERMSAAILKKAELFRIDYLSIQWKQLFEGVLA